MEAVEILDHRGIPFNLEYLVVFDDLSQGWVTSDTVNTDLRRVYHSSRPILGLEGGNVDNRISSQPVLG